MEQDTEVLLTHLEQIHTTELGAEKIKKNLSLQTEQVVDWCVDRIKSPHALIIRKGKNWYGINI